MKRMAALPALVLALTAPGLAQPQPLLNFTPSAQAPAPGSDAAGKALAQALHLEAAQLLSVAAPDAVLKARLRLFAAILLESADTLGPDGSSRALLARTIAADLPQLDRDLATYELVDSAGARHVAAALESATADASERSANPHRLLRDALAPVLDLGFQQRPVTPWGIARSDGPALTLSPPPGARPGFSGDAAALRELLEEAEHHPAYAPSAEAVARALGDISGNLRKAPDWLSDAARRAMGQALDVAVIELLRGEPDRAGAVVNQLRADSALPVLTHGLSAGATAPVIQTALSRALAAPEGDDRAASLRNYARVLDLALARQNLPDERSVIRQLRPAHRELLATLRGTEARLILALPDVLSRPAAMVDPGLIAAIGAHREALDRLRRVHRASALFATPGAAAEPVASDRWKRVADRLLTLGQELSRPDSRARALDALSEALSQIERFVALPGEDQLAAAEPRAALWERLAPGQRRELGERVAEARSRWVAAMTSKGPQPDSDEVRTLHAMRDLMELATALAALDVREDGTPGAAYRPLQAWAGWELAPATLAPYAAQAQRWAIQAAAACLLSNATDLIAAAEHAREGSSIVLIAGALAPEAARHGLTDDGALFQVALGAPPPDAWLADHIPALARICRYTEEAAAARKLGDAARAGSLEAYTSRLADEVLARLEAP
jgi:hypothetical protein